MYIWQGMDVAKRVAERYREAVIRKEKGEFCVRSPDNPDWSGGCYPTEEKAKERLKQVEYFKHKKARYDPADPAVKVEMARDAAKEAVRFLHRNYRFNTTTLQAIGREVTEAIYNRLLTL